MLSSFLNIPFCQCFVFLCKICYASSLFSKKRNRNLLLLESRLSLNSLTRKTTYLNMTYWNEVYSSTCSLQYNTPFSRKLRYYTINVLYEQLKFRTLIVNSFDQTSVFRISVFQFVFHIQLWRSYFVAFRFYISVSAPVQLSYCHDVIFLFHSKYFWHMLLASRFLF